MIAPFNRPLPKDDQALDKMIVKSYRDERTRRVRTVDDEFRDDITTNLPAGEFRLADISMHDLIQEKAFNQLGGEVAPDVDSPDYVCPHCGMKYLMPIPPQECSRCHTQTWFGKLVENRAFRR
ncbi:MAG: hypothetical protein WC936_07170 [Candidatus Nanoarchaeia archaeon]|jgi:rubrerythrin|nr:hypothetical protein [Clostridia bacterium]